MHNLAFDSRHFAASQPPPTLDNSTQFLRKQQLKNENNNFNVKTCGVANETTHFIRLLDIW